MARTTSQLLPLEKGWKEGLKIYGYRFVKFAAITAISLIICGVIGLLCILLHQILFYELLK